MHAPTSRATRSAVAVSLTLGAILAVAGPVGATHLGPEQSCTALVAPEGGAPGPSASVRVGESVEVHGLFPGGEGPAPDVRVRLEKDGEEQDLFTVERDEHDEILVVVRFEPGDEGGWIITAFMQDTGCGGPADVTVLAAEVTPATAPAASPTASALPDVAIETENAVPVPAILLGALLATLLGLLGGALLRRRATTPSNDPRA